MTLILITVHCNTWQLTLIAIPYIASYTYVMLDCCACTKGCIDSVECGTVEWNSGTVEWWNSGMVEWLDGRLTTLYCFAAVTVINTHAHFGATVASLFMLSVRGRYSYDRLLVPGNCKLRPRQWQIGFLLKGF